MKCPVCNYRGSRVMDSRPAEDDASIRRRRECPMCGKRFTTYEVVDTVPIDVVKRSGKHEFFDKHKLMLGIQRACQKRPVNAEVIAASIEAELQNSIVNEVTSHDIGEMVLKRLRDIDIVSYIRFASVYREFTDVDSFMEEIRSLGKGHGTRKKRSASAKAKDEKTKENGEGTPTSDPPSDENPQ